MPRRWYQTLPIDNVVFEDEKRKDSLYWNEGKWNSFVAPLLPNEGRTFLEIGTNAGLYLKMATDAGFTNVTGIEGNSYVMRQAREYKKSIDGKYNLVHEKVGGDLNLRSKPLADVVLIANAHYYFSIGAFSRLVDDLRNRCQYCIIVSAKAKRRSGNALYDLESVRGYFNDWKEIGLVQGVHDLGYDDPCPRERMYGILFESNLTQLFVDDYYDAWFDAAKNPEHRSYELAPALQAFTYEALYTSTRIEDTQLFKYWANRMPGKSLDWLTHKMYDKRDLVLSIQEHGIKEPIYLNKRLKLLDGLHRLSTAKALCYDHILARVL